MNTNHSYYPMEDGKQIRYQVFAITGAWNDSSFQMGILSRTYRRDKIISNSITTTPQFCGDLPLFVGYQHDTGTFNIPILYDQSLTDSIGMIDENWYIGELISQQGNVCIPPICKIPFVPVAGLAIENISKVYHLDETFMLNFKWKNKVVAHYDTWGKFQDVWRIGLREYHTYNNPQVFDTVYNYVFMKNVGLVDFWYGQFGADGKVRGYEFYAVEY